MTKSSTIALMFFLILQSIGSAQEWTYYDLSNSGIPSNSVLSVAIDQSNTVWVGTKTEGLAKYDQSTWTVYNPDNSPLPGKNIQKIVVSESGIWLNCQITKDQSVVGYLINIHNNEWRIWKNILNGGESYISDFDIDENGNIWMVTSAFGGWVIKFDGIEFSAYNNKNSCLPPIPYLPYTILCIGSEKRWIGYLENSFPSSNDSGVVFMDQNTCTHSFPTNDGFPTGHQSITEIHPDPNNDDIWFLSNKDIVNLSNGQWQTFDIGTSATTMAIDDHNGIWVALTFIGMRYIKDDVSTNYMGLPDYFVNQLVVDNNNGLWAATDSKGLAYFDIGQLDPTVVDEQTQETIKVYPTLFQDAITIEYNDEGPKEVQFYLYDLSGNPILKKDLNQSASIIDLNITHGSTFIYVVKRGQKILKTGKLIGGHSR